LAGQDVNYGTFVPNPGEDFSGNRLIRAPRFSGSLIADLDTPLTGTTRLLGRVEYSYRSSQFFRPSNEAFSVKAVTRSSMQVLVLALARSCLSAATSQICSTNAI
jgi:hypothetical protein